MVMDFPFSGNSTNQYHPCPIIFRVKTLVIFAYNFILANRLLPTCTTISSNININIVIFIVSPSILTAFGY